jgi:hypothetical protein
MTNHEFRIKQIAKIERIAKQIWNERCDDIAIEGDLAWYLDEYTEYDLLTRAEYDAVYDVLVELFNENK